MLIQTNADWISLFEGTKEANALSVAPLLFRIEVDPRNLRHGGLLSWIGERGTYTSSLMFLASPLSLRELARRLTERLEGIISENMEVLLRFYDPRIFEQLLLVLSDEQRSDFLCAASCWWYVDRRGDPQAVHSEFSNTERFTSPLILTASQETELVDRSEPDQVDEQLRLSLPNEYALLALPLRHKFITDQMAAGRHFGISSTRELSLYCSLALFYGSNFAERSNWSSTLIEIQAGKRNLTETVAGLTELPSE